MLTSPPFRLGKSSPRRLLLWTVPALAALAAALGLWGTRSGFLHGATHMHMEAAGEGKGATRPTTVVTPVSCEKLPNVPGKSITTAIVDFPPNAFTPRHRHPGSVSAFVLEGAVRSQLAGGPAIVYTKGQTWFEPEGAIHLFAENMSATDPAKLLAIFIAGSDCGALTIFD